VAGFAAERRRPVSLYPVDGALGKSGFLRVSIRQIACKVLRQIIRKVTLISGLPVILAQSGNYPSGSVNPCRPQRIYQPACALKIPTIDEVIRKISCLLHHPSHPHLRNEPDTRLNLQMEAASRIAERASKQDPGKPPVTNPTQRMISFERSVSRA
jgi:hypothetical protein